MSHKRIRSVNWDEEEKQLFRMLLKEYALVIENKALDTNSNKCKTKAWGELHKKFNELNSRPRELSQLKIQWKTMKINARKTLSSFKAETSKTGGGERPATPSDVILEIKDLLNPAELLKDHNIYDSDGVIPSSTETKVCPIAMDICETTLQDTISSLETCPEGQILEVNPQAIIIPIERTVVGTEDVDHPIMISEGTDLKPTPIKKQIDIFSAKRVPKRKLLNNNKVNEREKANSNKENDYINAMLSHSKKLKDEEHERRMKMAEEEHKRRREMAEEEHAIKMAIHREKLKYAILEREILEKRSES